MRLLIVDDNLDLLNDVSDAIGNNGFDVDTASNPLKALDAFRKHHYDAVLTDVRMPQMNGIVLLKKIKEIDPETKVIFMTAFSSMETSVATISDGAYMFVRKPFSMEKLIFVLRMADYELQRDKFDKKKSVIKKVSYDTADDDCARSGVNLSA